MRVNLRPEWILKNLKCIVVLLIFILIVCVPWLKLWAATNGTDPSLIIPDSVKSFFEVATGGGVGMAGSEYLRRQHEKTDPKQDIVESSGFLITLPGLHQQVQTNRREYLKEIGTIREEMKKIKHRINYINDFLDRKHEDFKSKETLY